MGHEINYETYVCGVYSQDLPRLIEENEEYQKSIENEIFALILMDPAKIRNQRRKSKRGDCDDDEWLNNAQYLTKLWEELKEQWQDSFAKVCRYGDAFRATENPHKEVDLCPDCHCEIEWIKEEVKNNDEIGLGYTYHKDVYKCPKCGKKYKYCDDGCCDDETDLPMPMRVTIRTWSEG